MVLLLAPEAYWPLRRVGAEFHAAAEGVATFEAASELVDADDATPHRRPGSMRLDHVSVLRPAAPYLLSTTSASICPSRGVTAVTGPSGCGKSTLLAVLAGLLEPTSGTVHGPTRDRIAWLPQRPVFVSGTVADNLRLAEPGAADDRLWDVLRRVALEERVRALPAGLDTALGEDGTTLSAGERARLALARVVLADRPWVLLDEPTAHLDAVTEQVIADTVQELGRTASVVVVAHRPALVALADRVVTLAVPEPVVVARPPRSAEPSRSRARRSCPRSRSRIATAASCCRRSSAAWRPRRGSRSRRPPAG